MIPKIIHCVWLSGEAMPEIYSKCHESWKRIMPNYEIKVWTKENFPINDYQFVKEACEAKKWAFATDFIRLWALYHYGGIYLDMDVYVFKAFDIFLSHRAFSCIDFAPDTYCKSIKKGGAVQGVSIEAAVLGSEKGHPWIKDNMDFYTDKHFYNDQKYCWSILMPKIMRDVSIEKYGFISLPRFQILKEGVFIYPAETFSFLIKSDIDLRGADNNYIIELASKNLLRYSIHLIAHSWWEDTSTRTISYKIKHAIILLFGKKFINRVKSLLGWHD